jgi:alkaline phosphatase D
MLPQVTNDGWLNGAQNHQPATEGDWRTRVQAALRAYSEWQPLRQLNGQGQRFYR